MFLIVAHYLKQRVSFVNIFCVFCGAITLHIYRNHIYFQRWRLDARYKNVAIENGIRPFPNQGNRGTARLWTLRSKFNVILEMIADPVFQSWMLFWKDLLKKSVMNTKPGQ